MLSNIVNTDRYTWSFKCHLTFYTMQVRHLLKVPVSQIKWWKSNDISTQLISHAFVISWRRAVKMCYVIKNNLIGFGLKKKIRTWWCSAVMIFRIVSKKLGFWRIYNVLVDLENRLHVKTVSCVMPCAMNSDYAGPRACYTLKSIYLKWNRK